MSTTKMKSIHLLRKFSAVAGLTVLLTTSVRAQVVSSPSDAVKQVENKYVCMVNDLYFKEVQIPVPVGDKTYYGCCQGCVETLKNDPDSRTATDPVSGAQVDKATAVAGALPDRTVRYFESEANLKAFTRSHGNKTEQ